MFAHSRYLVQAFNRINVGKCWKAGALISIFVDACIHYYRCCFTFVFCCRLISSPEVRVAGLYVCKKSFNLSDLGYGSKRHQAQPLMPSREAVGPSLWFDLTRKRPTTSQSEVQGYKSEFICTYQDKSQPIVLAVIFQLPNKEREWTRGRTEHPLFLTDGVDGIPPLPNSIPNPNPNPNFNPNPYPNSWYWLYLLYHEVQVEWDLLSTRRQSGLSFVPHFVAQSYSSTTSTTLHYCYCCTPPYLRSHPKLAYSFVKQLSLYVYYGHCTSTTGCSRWRCTQWERNNQRQVLLLNAFIFFNEPYLILSFFCE